jgi:membrane protease YdiL (CAAX protease family)
MSIHPAASERATDVSTHARWPAHGQPGHRVLAFVAVAFLVSWGWMLALAVTGASVEPGTGWPTHLPALLGPMAGALLVIGWTGGRPALRDLGRRMVLARCSPVWWLVALSPALLLAGALTTSALGWTTVDGSGLAVFSGISSGWGVVLVATTVVLVNGFGEETGWRGYAQPVLQQRHTPLVATVLVAGIWALWHAPMFLVLSSFRSFGPATLVGWGVGLLSGAVLLAWLYNRSGGSILLVALWHGGYNLVSATALGPSWLAAVSTVLVIAAALTLVVVELARTHAGRPSVLLPQPPAAAVPRLDPPRTDPPDLPRTDPPDLLDLTKESS